MAVPSIFSVNVDYSFTWPLSDCPLESGTTVCADLNKGDVHLPPSSVSFECIDGATEETQIVQVCMSILGI